MAFLKKKGYDTVIFYFVLVAGTLISVVLFLAFADTTPATAEDYAPLYEQVQELKSDFSSLGDFDNVKSTSEKKGKIVLDGGKQCDLVVYYDKDFNITATSEIDKSLTVPQFVATLFFSAIAGFAVSFVIVAAFFTVLIVIEEASKKKKSAAKAKS